MFEICFFSFVALHFYKLLKYQIFLLGYQFSCWGLTTGVCWGYVSWQLNRTELPSELPRELLWYWWNNCELLWITLNNCITKQQLQEILTLPFHVIFTSFYDTFFQHISQKSYKKLYIKCRHRYGTNFLGTGNINGPLHKGILTQHAFMRNLIHVHFRSVIHVFGLL
jgi:hypothetical protein